jgi:signal transduction histidine kinase
MAERVGGGLALVFAAAPGNGNPAAAARLRAAAGFGAAQEARDAAEQLMPRVQEVLATRSPSVCPPHPALGERARGGLVVHPLIWEERTHGALVVAFPEALDESLARELAEATEFLSLHFDHAHLADGQVDDGTEGAEKSEEILKLSEALFAQDIELLRNNEKLSKVEKLKNDFIERMSRELRTSLNRIIEGIISVRMGENEALSEEGKQTLRGIKQGELPVEIQDVNFREIVDEAIFSVQDAASAKPLVIDQEIEDSFPKIRTDVAKINQILFLLLDNAVKFTQRGRVTISARLEDERLHCEVRDTGVGICADDQHSIFDEFYQVDEPASRRYTGSGLGLTLVRDLVVLLDGEIAVQSEVGGGSTFAISLPVQPLG